MEDESQPKPINETLSGEMDALLKSDEQINPTPMPTAVQQTIETQNIQEQTEAQKPTTTKWPNIVSWLLYAPITLLSLAAGPGTYIVAQMVGPYGWVVTMGYIPFIFEIACQISIPVFIGFLICLICAEKKQIQNRSTIQAKTFFAFIQIAYILFLLTSGMRIKTLFFIISNGILAIVPYVLIPVIKKIKSKKLFIAAVTVAIIGLIYPVCILFMLLAKNYN